MTPFSTIDNDVVAAIREWGGLAALTPKPVIQFAMRYNDIAENRKAFGGRPTVWIVPIQSQSNPRFTADTQLITLRYRVYLIQPSQNAEAARDCLYNVNAALIQFSNWKTAAGDALAAPTPWAYHNIVGPRSIEPSRYSDLEQDIEDLLGVIETSLDITALHSDLMTVPDMTLEPATLTIAAVDVGTVEKYWDTAAIHIPDTMEIKYEGGAKPLRRVSWMKFPLDGIADAVAINGLTLGYTITTHDGIIATGSIHLASMDVPNAPAEDVWDEFSDGVDLETLDLGSAGAKTTEFMDPEGAAASLLAAIQSGASHWIVGLTYFPFGPTSRACVLSENLALSTLEVDYDHYV